MPRLLQVTTNFEHGAIPNILLDLAPHWSAHGWDVSFLALEPFSEDESSVLRCRSLGYPLESLGVPSRSALRALASLGSALRRLGPDLIHTHLGRADVYTPWVKGNVPMISTFHSVRHNSGRLTQWGWKWTDGKVAHRTGVSQACVESLYADGFLSSPHSVIYNPVDVERLVPARTPRQVKQSFGWDEGVRLLVAVGRLVPAKDQTSLVSALERLTGRYPELRLVIAGEGPLRAALEAQVAAAGLTGKVALPGVSTSVADLYHAAEMVVFPSLWEGLGLVPLEALACGCPVASSRLPAVEEFLTDHQTGRFFEPGNPESLASCVDQMLREPEVVRREAVAGQLMVCERFAADRIAGQYEALYGSVLNA